MPLAAGSTTGLRGHALVAPGSPWADDFKHPVAFATLHSCAGRQSGAGRRHRPIRNEHRYGGRILDHFDNVRHVAAGHPPAYDPFQAWVDVPVPLGPDWSGASQPTIIQRASGWPRLGVLSRRPTLPRVTPTCTIDPFTAAGNGEAWTGWRLFGQDYLTLLQHHGLQLLRWHGSPELFSRNWDFEIMYDFTRRGAPGNWYFWTSQGSP